jgi:tetratricopeptide (TPR) repeat protein
MLSQSLVLMLVAQFSGIDGQVRDARTHREIPSAKVDVSSSRVPIDRQYSDRSGRFRLENLQPGSYVLSVESPGYEPATVEIDVVPPRTPGPVIVELVRRQTQSDERAQAAPLNQYTMPKTARKEFESARKDANRNDCSSAVTHFENGLRLFGNDAVALNDLGNCYRKLGEMDSAEAAFKRAIALSDSVYISLNLAELYESQERFREAKDVFIDVIRRSPKQGDAYYGLAALYFHQGLFEAAKTNALQASSLTHKIADVHLLLAKIYLRDKDQAAVISQLEMYINEDPKSPVSAKVKQALRQRCQQCLSPTTRRDAELGSEEVYGSQD